MSKNMEHFRRACTYFNVSFPATVCPHIFHKVNVLLLMILILNIKPCLGQITGKWELLTHGHYRKSVVIGEKILTSKN
jgi:hypothetical protein